MPKSKKEFHDMLGKLTPADRVSCSICFGKGLGTLEARQFKVSIKKEECFDVKQLEISSNIVQNKSK
jgi:hypothetical protein